MAGSPEADFIDEQVVAVMSQSFAAPDSSMSLLGATRLRANLNRHGTNEACSSLFEHLQPPDLRILNKRQRGEASRSEGID